MKKILFIIIILLTLLFLYGRYIEPNNIIIKEYTINTEKIPESFKELKIVHFSDFVVCRLCLGCLPLVARSMVGECQEPAILIRVHFSERINKDT